MELFKTALEYLSPRLREAALRLWPDCAKGVCEIRLRRDLPLSFSTYSGNVFAGGMQNAIKCSAEDMKYAVNRLCAGSVYRYADTLKKGYIVTPEGLRAGICGQAIYNGDKIEVVDGYTGINLRIPRRITGCAHGILQQYADGVKSTLIYSPPGVGKTTLIRELALKLSEKLRVSVVDERCEILPEIMLDGCGMCDILRGYSKPDGMEIAVRTLSPQVIICDEIGAREDIPALLSVQNCGAALIATCHAQDAKALMAKPNILKLCQNGVFERFVRLYRGQNGMQCCFERAPWD